MSDATKVQTEYFVSKGEDTLGPWTLDEIVAKLATGEVEATDYLFEDAVQDWVPVMECAALKERMAKKKPKAPPPSRAQAASTLETPAPLSAVQAEAPQSSSASSMVARGYQDQPELPKTSASKATVSQRDGAEWFVQKGPNRYGPFTYHGLVRALQEKTVYDFDFVWKNGMSTWVRLAEHPMFQPERIRELTKEVDDEDQVFLRRQHPRHSYQSEVIVHDDRSVWMGKAFEASVGGSGLVIENATLVPGQVVRLHFASTDELPAFNALCEIVGKQFTSEIRGTGSPVKYAVRFLKLDGSMEPQVRKHFGEKQQKTVA